MSDKLLINGIEYPLLRDAASAVELLQHLRKRQMQSLGHAHLLVLECEGPTQSDVVAALRDTSNEGIFAAVLELLGTSKPPPAGYLEGVLSPLQLEALKRLFVALAGTDSLSAALLRVLNAGEQVAFDLFFDQASDESMRELFVEAKVNALFELFNAGALRGVDSTARQALLDSFTLLPNRFLSAGGAFIEIGGGGEHFIAGIDKFPSLMSMRGAELAYDGNRIVPGAMIRNGVHVGKRNIFMFHSAVNIAAFIGDDNLIDSHASVGSAAYVGNGNKLGSFVSLEGVLSPSNSKGVVIGDNNFLGSFVRVGAGITVGNQNFLGSGVNLSLGTKLKDCRPGAKTYATYVTCRDLLGQFDRLALAPNNAVREFEGVKLLPGEYILFENDDEFKARFEGDQRIRA